MNTQNFAEDIKAYLDGELSPERAQQVRDAITSDADLAKEAAFMQKLSASIRAVNQGPVPKVSAPKRSPLKLLRLSPAFAWLAASAAVVAGTVGVVRHFTIPNAPKEPLASTYAGEDMKSAVVPRAGRSLEIKQDNGAALLQTPRSVIRSANVTIRVQNIQAAEDAITKYVKSIGGFIESSEARDSEGQPKSDLVLRVPFKRFDEAIDKLLTLGVRIAKSTTGEDVTKQLIDSQARLKNLKAKEETYRKILGQARTVGQVLQIEDYLSSVRSEIESLETELKTLNGEVALSTISVALVQSSQSADASAGRTDWASEAWGNAAAGLQSAMRAIGIAAIYAFTYSPIWLCGLFVAWLLVRAAKRSVQT